MLDAFRDSIHEFSELERFLSPENADARRVVFYSESDIYYCYFVDYIEALLSRSNIAISYLTSSRKDPVFALASERFRPFYIKNMLNAAFSRLDSKVLILTAPDIGNCAIKRAPDPVHHLYIFHGISSVHQVYRPGAFDNYDSIFCLGDYQVRELLKLEKLDNLIPKHLIETGYPPVERLNREHQHYVSSRAPGSPPVCLIAPTWGPSSIMEHCIYELLESLRQTSFEVWIRPHPQYIREKGKALAALQKYVAKHPNLKLNLPMSSLQALHEADVLFTDYSSIALEYVLGIERPLIYIDTPERIDNPEFVKLEMEPIEASYRDKLGARIQLPNIADAGKIATELYQDRDRFRETLQSIRPELVANWGNSANIGADYIIKLANAAAAI